MYLTIINHHKKNEDVAKASYNRYCFLYLTTFAGLPAITLYGGNDFVTTADAPTILPLPIITPGSIVTREPIHTSSSMTTGLSLDQPC